MICPVCNRTDKTILVCSTCWWEIPAKDRVIFNGCYHRRRTKDGAAQMRSKGEQIVRCLKAKRAELVVLDGTRRGVPGGPLEVVLIQSVSAPKPSLTQHSTPSDQ